MCLNRSELETGTRLFPRGEVIELLYHVHGKDRAWGTSEDHRHQTGVDEHLCLRLLLPPRLAVWLSRTEAAATQQSVLDQPPPPPHHYTVFISSALRCHHHITIHPQPCDFVPPGAMSRMLAPVGWA
jgi:hypothetical protein